MSDKLRKVIQNQDMFSKKDLLLVGVSGGMDSMVLCHLLLEQGFAFGIAHCNYHLRGLESDLDEQFIKEWAIEHRISVFIKSCPLPNKNNIQDEARKVRYDFFNEVKEKNRFKYILTAHHANDQIETFFINLSRGAGIKGLKGIAIINNELIRPLVGVYKKEITTYATENNIVYREDQTNKHSDYLRNFFRNDILPLINNRIPAFNEMNLRSIHHLSELTVFLEQVFSEWKYTNVTENEKEIKIRKPDLNKFYLLSNYLVALGFHPETINQLKNRYQIVGRLFTDKNKHELLVDRDYIYIRKEKNRTFQETYLIDKNCGELNLTKGLLNWKLDFLNGRPINLPEFENEAVFNINGLIFPLLLRKWLPGDVIKPLGMNGHSKKIQDVLTNSKISIFDKENIFVLISNEEILWVPGVIRSEIAKIDERSNSYFKICWVPLVEKH